MNSEQDQGSSAAARPPAQVTMFTDGACSGNPGPGGWAAILLLGKLQKEFSGGYRMTTNNRMELRGVIEGLRRLKWKCKVSVYSDSKYVVDSIGKGWLAGWRTRGWKTSDKKPVKNRDLWEELLVELGKHEVSFDYVEGHSTSELNNRCDELAVAAYQNGKLEEDAGFVPAEGS